MSLATVLNFLLYSVVVAFEEEKQYSQNLFGKEISIASDIVAGVAIPLGLFYTFYGFRFFRVTLFTAGFAAGGIIGFPIANKITRNSTAVLITCLVLGLLGGVIVMCVYKLGVFLIGAAGGIFLALFLQNSFLYKIAPEDPKTVLYVAIAVLGLSGGLLAYFLQRPMLILLTSFCGAYAKFWGIGYFAGKYPSAGDLKAWKNNGAIEIPSVWWIYFSATWLLFFMGVFTQFKYTARTK